MQTLMQTLHSRPQRRGPLTVATVPMQVPVMEAGDLPAEEDWAVIESLGVDTEFDHELQYDRYGSLRLAPVAFD